jgi:uncharacterized protein (TIGR02449 family)
MDISKLDQLESNILVLIEHLSKLKTENASLRGKIGQLEKENAVLIEERGAIKSRVEGMLKNLEGLGIEGNETYHAG